MKKTSFIKALLSFVAFLIVVLFAATELQHHTNLPDVPAFAIAFVAAVAIVFISVFYQRGYKGIVRNGVEVEIWAQYIIERFWKDNKFMQFMFSDDDKVLAGKIVHIPQPGARPNVIKNRSSFPGTAVTRTDTDVTYNLDVYTTDPTHITDAEKVELSYDKINSVYGDHAGFMSQDVADDAIYKFLTALPQAQIQFTAGASTGYVLNGSTGTRKAADHTDLRKIQHQMNRVNIPIEDRVGLLNADMMDEVLASLSNTQYRDFSSYVDAANGVLGRLHGFDLMLRSDVATAEVVSSVCSVNPAGTAVGADTRSASMFWQKNALARAMGEVKFFENPNQAVWYGDVYSALLRFGGRRRRGDDSGVYMLAQGE